MQWPRLVPILVGLQVAQPNGWAFQQIRNWRQPTLHPHRSFLALPIRFLFGLKLQLARLQLHQLFLRFP
jgi:hypothetical protein